MKLKQVIKNLVQLIKNLFTKRQSSVFTETDKPPMVGVAPVVSTVVVPPTPQPQVSSPVEPNPNAGANPPAVQEVLDRILVPQSRERTPEELAAYRRAAQEHGFTFIDGVIPVSTLNDDDKRYLYAKNQEFKIASKGLRDLYTTEGLIMGDSYTVSVAKGAGDILWNGYTGNINDYYGVLRPYVDAAFARLGN